MSESSDRSILVACSCCKTEYPYVALQPFWVGHARLLVCSSCALEVNREVKFREGVTALVTLAVAVLLFLAVAPVMAVAFALSRIFGG